MIGEIAGVATAIAVFVAAAGLFTQTRARKFGLAQVYIERYWEVDEFFLRDGYPAPGSVNARRYLRLCEDEFDAARLGWVDIAVWRAWHAGIRSQVFELGLHEHKHNQLSKYGQLKRCSTKATMSQPSAKALGRSVRGGSFGGGLKVCSAVDFFPSPKRQFRMMEACD